MAKTPATPTATPTAGAPATPATPTTAKVARDYIPAKIAAPTTAKVARDYIPAKIAAPRSDLQMPKVGSSTRGGKSIYPFDDLAVGTSFAVLNKTAKEMSSTVSSAKRRYQVEEKDANGNIVFKTQKVKLADGTESITNTLDPKMVDTRVFFCVETDPATDPDGAMCRVWRSQ